MGNIVIAGAPVSDTGTISSGAAALSAANLQTFQPSQVWRPAGFGDAWVEVDLGAATAINLVALLYTNVDDSGTWRIRGATSQANLTAAPGYDSTAIGFWPQAGLDGWPFVHGFHWLGASGETYRWWRVDLFNATNPAGFLQAGRLYIADAWQPSQSISYGWSIGRDDVSPIAEAPGGAAWPTVRPPRRRLEFTLKFLTETEMMSRGFELERAVGKSRDVLVIRDPDDTTNVHHQMVYGLMAELLPIVNPDFDQFEKVFRVREAL